MQEYDREQRYAICERQWEEGKSMDNKMYFHARIKSQDDDSREVEGWASTRDLDSMGDVVHPEGFLNLDEYMRNPVLTYQHNWEQPIGHVRSVSVKDDGLWVKAYIDSTEDRIWKKIKEGTLRAFSIGYEPVEEEIMGDGINHLVALNLLEIAVVTLPANTECLFSVAKSLEGGTDLRKRKAEKEKEKEEDLITLTPDEAGEVIAEVLRLHKRIEELEKYKDFALKQLKL